ncbi:hypothetical protein MJN85_29685, partial [Salmonella enterica subsp. enterica serovar Anatum]|nr:hypothetical protein [Salmonella enterica subsp. enterica serovar Anatum]
MESLDHFMDWLAVQYISALNIIHYMHDKYSYEASLMALHDRDKTAEERDGYIAYIDELYNANRLTEILSETCSIIGANILNIAR